MYISKEKIEVTRAKHRPLYNMLEIIDYARQAEDKESYADDLANIRNYAGYYADYINNLITNADDSNTGKVFKGGVNDAAKAVQDALHIGTSKQLTVSGYYVIDYAIIYQSDDEGTTYFACSCCTAADIIELTK